MITQPTAINRGVLRQVNDALNAGASVPAAARATGMPVDLVRLMIRETRNDLPVPRNTTTSAGCVAVTCRGCFFSRQCGQETHIAR
ncbi:hypothetical protein [Jonesia quinghaiensis]|uniref:hypothetical protein n=1 Tax=Jonesia quinghaiensis TaxID=262806 RepID=UPI00041242FD|nr:hypothetical protein [Jonesia quinghaiensis]